MPLTSKPDVARVWVRFVRRPQVIAECMGRSHSEALRDKLLEEGYPLHWDVTSAGLHPQSKPSDNERVADL